MRFPVSVSRNNGGSLKGNWDCGERTALIPGDLSSNRRWRRAELAQPRGSERGRANTVSFSDQKPLYCTWATAASMSAIC